MEGSVLWISPTPGDPQPPQEIRWENRDCCAVFADWAALEPVEGELEPTALEALRSELILTGTRGADPALCLFRNSAPAWFLERGGWAEEDCLRCFLRYVGRLVRAVGHLADVYVTFYEPNEYVWHRQKQRTSASFRELSHIASVHARAVRLIRDTRWQRGLPETGVGFVLRMAPSLYMRRALLRGASRTTASGYQKLPLLAMAKGEFLPPLRNTLRIVPGEWADFIGVSCIDESMREQVRAETRALTQLPLWDVRTAEGE